MSSIRDKKTIPKTTTTRRRAKEPSLSEYLHSAFVFDHENNNSSSSSSNTLSCLYRILSCESVDSYIELPSSSSKILLPPFDWTSYRKGYSILSWIQIVESPPNENSKDDNEDEDEEDLGGMGTTLFRISTSDSDLRGSGVCARVHRWRRSDNTSNTSNTNTNSNKSSSSKESKGSKGNGEEVALEGTLIVRSLPLEAAGGMSGPISLPLNRWLLLGITHSFPYLRRPRFGIAIDGEEILAGDLPYPSPDHRGFMSNNLLFSSFLPPGYHLRLCSLTLYPDTIPPPIQAMSCEHGPPHDGRSIPTVPPISQNRDSSNRNPDRALGIPLSVGVPLASDGTGAGDLAAQKLATRAIVGFGSKDATNLSQRITISSSELIHSAGASDNVPKVGLLRPNPPTRNGDANANQNKRPTNGSSKSPLSLEIHAHHHNLTLHHAVYSFYKATNKAFTIHHNRQINQPPSLLLSYQSVNPFAKLLLFLRLALPPPAAIFGLQKSLAEDSHKRLQTLAQSNFHALSKIIHYIAITIHLGGRFRDQALQQGVIPSLSSLLRRVLLRYNQLSHVTYFTKDHNKDLASTNNDHHSSCPPTIPPSVVTAIVAVIDACCGPTALSTNHHNATPTKTISPASTHVRRTSDLAMTALFSLGLNHDLWGNDANAASVIVGAIADRYASPPDVFFTSASTGRKATFPGAYGWILRGQASIQSFLDHLRLRYDFQNSNNNTTVQKSIDNLVRAFSRILDSILWYSLSSDKSVTRAERDVSSMVHCLASEPLHSVASRSTMMAFLRVLIRSGAIRDPAENGTNNIVPSSPITSQHRLEGKTRRSESFLQISKRLGRNMAMARFLDVVAPILLSRTMFDGHRHPPPPPCEKDTEENKEEEQGEEDVRNEDIETVTRENWRHCLLIFSWLASIAGPEGIIAAKSTGSLLLASGQAGSLYGYLQFGNNNNNNNNNNNAPTSVPFVTSLLLPPTALSASFRDSQGKGMTNDGFLQDLSHRLRVVLPLLPGLVASLVSPPTSSSSTFNDEDNKDQSHNQPNNNIPKQKKNFSTAKAVESLTDLLLVVRIAFRCLDSNGNNKRSVGTDRNTPASSSSSSTPNVAATRVSVKAVKEAVPPLLQIASMLDAEIIGHETLAQKESSSSSSGSEMTTEFDSDWVDVAAVNSGSSSSSGDDMENATASRAASSSVTTSPTHKELASKLAACQVGVLHTASRLIVRAMIEGSGEASTIVWRVVISTLSSFCPEEDPFIQGKEKNMASSDKIENGSNDPNNDTQQTTTTTTQYNDRKDDSRRAFQERFFRRSKEAHSLLCHLSSLVLVEITAKADEVIHKDDEFDESSVKQSSWRNPRLCSATARLCDLVEEKELIPVPMGRSTPEKRTYSADQARLLCALLVVMSSGRRWNGWSQTDEQEQLENGLFHEQSPHNVVSLDQNNPETKEKKRQLRASTGVSSTSKMAAKSWAEAEFTKATHRFANYIDGSLLLHAYERYHHNSNNNNSSKLEGNSSSSGMDLGREEMMMIMKPDINSLDGGDNQHPRSLFLASSFLLPILQPCLRVVLSSFGYVGSDLMAVIPSSLTYISSSNNRTTTNPDPKKRNEQQQYSKKSLLSYISEEMRLTLIGAIGGLSFHNSRDLCLNVLSSLRRAIVIHKNNGDDVALALCHWLILTCVKEMRLRYVQERRKRERAQFDAYDDFHSAAPAAEQTAVSDPSSHTPKEQQQQQHQTVMLSRQKSDLIEEAESSLSIERLILGDDICPNNGNNEGAGNNSQPKLKNESSEGGKEEAHSFGPTSNQSHVSAADDFILFPGQVGGDSSNMGGGGGDSSNNDILQEGNHHLKKENHPVMGWSNYKGFGAALEKCCVASNLVTTSTAAAADANTLKTTAAAVHDKVGMNKRASDVLIILSPFLDTWDERQARDASESEMVELFNEAVHIPITDRRNRDVGRVIPRNPTTGSTGVLGGSETAADAMTSFIELSTFEFGRVNDLKDSILPKRRSSHVGYADRLCWKEWMESYGSELVEEPQWERCVADCGREYGGRIATVPAFPQFPRSIPAYLDHGPRSESDCNDDESGLYRSNRSLDDIDWETRDYESTPQVGEIKSLLESGQIKIVDITKKQDEDDEDVDMEDFSLLNEAADDAGAGDDDDDLDDDGSILFPEADEREKEKRMGRTNEKPAQEEEDAAAPDGSKSDAEITHASTGSAASSSQPIPQLVYQQQQQQDAIRNPHQMASSSGFCNPPDGGTPILSSQIHSRDATGVSAGGGNGVVELYFGDCLHVKAEGSRKGILFVTGTHLILEYDDESGGLFEGEVLAMEESLKKFRDAEMDENKNTMRDNPDSSATLEEGRANIHRTTMASFRPRSMRWNVSELSHIYLRRYRLRDSALELFFIPTAGSTNGGTGLFPSSRSIFFDFGPGNGGRERRDSVASAIMKRAPSHTVKQWPDKSTQFLQEQLRTLTGAWVKSRISNFDYLLSLNCLAGRSYNDLCQYPVMPWVLSDYSSNEVPDLTDPSNFRDLSKPMGALNPERLKEFIERFETFQDPTIPPFMYGSHYSTSAGVVLHFLVRLHPFADLHRQLQSGHFDVADRLFSSVPRTWDMCTGSSAAEVKELTPEWYCNPSFLRNVNRFKLGTSQDGEVLGDVVLPPWADGCPEKFVEIMRCALESDICSESLPYWIDLIFGRKQQGPEAIQANNVFFYLTYYGSVDVASIEDEGLRNATEMQIAHFGQCPMQLFSRAHPKKLERFSSRHRLSLTKVLDLFYLNESLAQSSTQMMMMGSSSSSTIMENQWNNDNNKLLPFRSAPTSYWVYLSAPPPGPHAPLIAVRLAGSDRCLGIDARGIFHFFRWAWKPQETGTDSDEDNNSSGEDWNDALFADKGFFIAQRELNHFRSIPRLPYSISSSEATNTGPNKTNVTVAISKSLFAARSLLLILSDGDTCGALAMQLVDPVKGFVKSELIVPAVHSARISAIAMDPFGTAAGHGGVGGELAVVGSADGEATLWRFISSQFLPLRPRLRLGGHGGSYIQAVAVNSILNLCVTVSKRRCCLFDATNGMMIRSFRPTTTGARAADYSFVSFAETPALCISPQGFIILVSNATTRKDDGDGQEVVILQLYSLEGILVGSTVLEPWRGTPSRILPTSDGRAVMVCCGGGVTFHVVSTVSPLKLMDGWKIPRSDTTTQQQKAAPFAYDVDFAPSLMRPVVAAAACSSGALCLHALRGISDWSAENQKATMTAAVGNALAKPAQKLKSVVGGVRGMGARFVGFGKEIGRDTISDVKDRAGGLLGVFKQSGS